MRSADSLEKTLTLGKTEGKRRRAAEDEVVRGHHQLSGHEPEQTLEDSGGQRSLAGYSRWGRKASGTTQRLNDKHPRRLNQAATHSLGLRSVPGGVADHSEVSFCVQLSCCTVSP